MAKQRILFLGSKPIGYHCLHYLIEYVAKHEIVLCGILTNDNPVFANGLSLRQLASNHQIPIINSLEEMPEVDIIYSVQYHEILLAKHIARAKEIAVNLHMAPLPEYRGCNQFSFAIADGKTEFGTTVHKMEQSIDGGDILFERRFPIPFNCWVEELYQLTFDASLDLFIETLPAILAGNYPLQAQKDLIPSRGTSIHYRNEIHALKQIDLSLSKEEIEKRIRATAMPGFEPPFCIVNDEKLYFSKTWQ